MCHTHVLMPHNHEDRVSTIPGVPLTHSASGGHSDLECLLLSAVLEVGENSGQGGSTELGSPCAYGRTHVLHKLNIRSPRAQAQVLQDSTDTGCPSRGAGEEREVVWSSAQKLPIPLKPHGYLGDRVILPLPQAKNPPVSHHLPYSLLHLSHVFQEDAASTQQGRGGAATKEDPTLGQVSQHQPHQLTQIQASNHLLKPEGGKGGWTKPFLSPQSTSSYLQAFPKKDSFLWGSQIGDSRSNEWPPRGQVGVCLDPIAPSDIGYIPKPWGEEEGGREHFAPPLPALNPQPVRAGQSQESGGPRVDNSGF